MTLLLSDCGRGWTSTGYLTDFCSVSSLTFLMRTSSHLLR